MVVPNNTLAAVHWENLNHWLNDGTSKRRVKKLGTWILSFSSMQESRAAHLKGRPLRWAALDSSVEEKLRIHVPSFFTLLLLVPSSSLEKKAIFQ